MQFDSALIASATLLGLSGSAHCAVMCSAPCATAVAGGGLPARIAFHAARSMGYMAAGAVVASSVSALSTWSQLSPVLRPLWHLLNAAALVLGLYLLWWGRQPRWMSSLGAPRLATAGATWQPITGPARAAASGALWFAWPCGLLQSALLVASMSSHAASGAAAMLGFALASAPGLALGPWAFKRLLGGGTAESRERWAARAAGVLLAIGSAVALGQGIWSPLAAMCRSWIE